jgi:hypothetical protein
MNTAKFFAKRWVRSSLNTRCRLNTSILFIACSVNVGLASAQGRTIDLPTKGASINQVSPGLGKPQHMGRPPQGDGSLIVPVPRPATPIIGLPGPGNGPSPSIPNVSLPSSVRAPISNNPPPGIEPTAPSTVQITSPAPVLATLPAPPPPVSVEYPKKPDSIPTQGIGSFAELPPSVTGSSITPVTSPPISMPPPQGTGPKDNTTPSVGVPSSILPTSAPHTALPAPPQQGTGQHVSPVPNSSGSNSSKLQEILPASASLLSTMQIQSSSPASAGTAQDASAPKQACVVITLRPDTQRPATTLVDFTGDGLIRSAISDTHIQQVFARSGYSAVDTSKPARWCITQAAARELVQARVSTSRQVASVLVQTETGWQLMTQSQWALHQAALTQAAASSALIQPKQIANATRKTIKRSSVNRTPVRVAARPNLLTAMVTPAAKLK